jgi:Zn finger protein HypA/HybF involved in hydrogenase expression
MANAKKRKVNSPIQRVKKKEPEVVQEQKPQKGFRDYLNVFEFDTVLPGTGETVRFKPLTVGHVKRLVTSINPDDVTADDLEPDVASQMFESIVDNSVVTEGFDITQLYSFDRYFLLLEIRKKTKGEVEEFQIKCPECKSQSMQNINFDAIEIKSRPKDVDYNIQLTDDLSVVLRYTKVEHEHEAFVAWRANLTGNKMADRADCGLFMEAQMIDQIVTPNGSEDVSILDKKYLIENIPQPVYQKIKDWYDENRFGPVMQVSIECPHCGHTDSENITNMDFF